ncbi:hypothetical protein [Methanosarcina sp.]|uniref:hypothetical protein n=1 Tax=Methanosarcina sp. TaxID=2213 RepID=UPI0029897BFC|nr:hypothetical protein [Methanosarcina sp.]MDW5549208.1 hypothetical protein [Methanosarcina sp.]MDW5553086.1 hypothetical protein [Methanosarcina sp.]MDW5559388.1 hypothetical protein [Methanosarcina sp.]
MLTYVESTPYLIAITIAMCIYIGKNVKLTDKYALDCLLAIAGVLFGIFMTIGNLLYTSGELFLLSPLIAITSVLYLRLREKIAIKEVILIRDLKSKTFKKINVLFWILLSFAIICNYLATIFHRPLIFFIIMSTCIALTGFEIICTNIKSSRLVLYVIIKILVMTLILSSSSYFLSPYPIGSDPWVHAEYIKNYIHYGELAIKSGIINVDAYYLVYPIMHLFCTMTTLILDTTVKNSMYIIGSILILSSIFTYLLAREITKSENIALFSMLLVGISSSHLQWSIQIIAMSFGIAIYAILMYIFLTKKGDPLYNILIILFLITIIWTHTISSFILLVSIAIFTIGSKLIDALRNERSATPYFNFVILVIVILVFQWTDIRYTFMQKVLSGLIYSFSAEAKFLGGTNVSNIVGTWSSLYKYCGNISYILFGIIGTLYFLSKRELQTRTIALIGMIATLYVFRYAFPVFGMRNIIPDRWPAFILVSFAIFIAVGFYRCIYLISNKKKRIGTIVILLFSLSFMMITDSGSNLDSPIYGGNTAQRFMWTESEMNLLKTINYLHKDIIVADLQTSSRPLETYLQRDPKYLKDYEVTKEGKINWDEMDGRLIIWRKISLDRPLTVTINNTNSRTEMLLGTNFKESMDYRYGCIYDVGEAKAYI